jgi:hypothetical protein
VPIWLLVVTAVIGVASNFVERWLFPPGVFAIGGGERRFHRHQGLLNVLLVGVVLGVTLNVLAAFIYTALTRQ